MGFESFSQRLLKRFLDGPETFRPAALDPERHYRSSTVALGAWTYGLLRLFLAPAAFWTGPVLLITAVTASIAMDAPMRVLLPVAAAIFAVDFTAGWILRPKIELHREMPEHIRAGCDFRVRFRIRNRRRFLPCPELFCDPFHYAPGVRLKSPAVAPECRAGETVLCDAECTALRRGIYDIYPARAESHFPFSLIKWSTREPDSAGRLFVHPAFPHLEHVELPPGARSRKQTHGGFSRLGESADPAGVRDYRDGDDIRHIDWAGSARSGDFVVKEFEENDLRRIALITDTHLPEPHRKWYSLHLSAHFSYAPRPELETAISLAAALADYFSRGEAVVDLFVAGTEVHRFETGRARGSFSALCDLLCTVRASAKPALPELAPEVFADLEQTGAAAIILLGDDRERRDFVLKLQVSGVACRVFLVAPTAPPDLPPGWTIITPDQFTENATRRL